MVKTASGSTLCAFDDAATPAAPRSRCTPLAVRRRCALGRAPGQRGTAPIHGRLDYFGDSVESALDLLAHAPAKRILLSSVIADDPGVMAELTGAGHELQLLDFDDEAGWGVAVAPRERDR